MNEIEAIESILQTEQRMLQRQQLLKRMWRLNQREKSSQLLAETNRQKNRPASEETAKRRNATESVYTRTAAVA